MKGWKKSDEERFPRVSTEGCTGHLLKTEWKTNAFWKRDHCSEKDVIAWILVSCSSRIR
jgi:hypothetical protein